MQTPQLDEKWRNRLSFLKQEALGALGALWRPTWWTWVAVTLGVGLLIIYSNFAEPPAEGDFVFYLIGAFLAGGYVGAFVAIPIGVANFLWRLFGWGTILVVILAPLAFLLTAGVLSPWLFAMVVDLQQAVELACQRHEVDPESIKILTALGEAGRVATFGSWTASFGKFFGGVQIPTGVVLLMLALHVLSDLAHLQFDSGVLWSLSWLLGSTGVILFLAIGMALVVSLPILIYTFSKRSRERYREFNSEE